MKRRQYTIRNIPDQIDRELRRRAAEERKSLNAVILEALQESCGFKKAAARHHDLDFLIGTWIEDPQFDEAMDDFERIDSEAWQ